jgi:hypothetical protein
MSNVAYANFGQSQGIQPLSFDEIDAISGASELGENVIAFGGTGGAIGSLAGPKGAAVGILVGAAVGVIVTILD